MKKLSFPLITDVLFYSACAFIFSFCVARYYSLALWLCFFIAFALSLAVSGVSFLVLYLTHQKKFLTKKQLLARDAFLFHLALEKEERVRALLLEAFTADGRDAHCEGDAICVDGKIIYPLFSLEPVSADEIAHLIRKFGTGDFTVACKSLSPEAEKLLKTFSIAALKEDDVFGLCSRTGTIPEKLICGEVKRKTLKSSLTRAFKKSNAHPFFVGGVLLLIMSLFTFFPIYYLTTGIVLLCLSIGIRILGTA